jgi:hypothetical protein
LKMWRWNLKVPQEIRRRFSVGDGNGRRCSLTNIRWIIMGWVRFSVWSVDSICVSILPFCCIRDAITNLGFLVGFFFIVSRFTGKRTPSRNSLTSCCLRSSRVNKDIIVSISLEIYFISNEIYKQKKSTRRFPLVIRCLSFRSYKGERKTIDFLVVCVCVSFVCYHVLRGVRKNFCVENEPKKRTKPQKEKKRKKPVDPAMTRR